MHRLQHLHLELARRRARCAVRRIPPRARSGGADWHPERFAPPASDSNILIVGGGPAGLECATTLARRGYSVTIADSADEFGGRLRFETALPGLKTWSRVADWRLGQLRERPNVNLYPGSALGVDDILGSEHRHVVIATGARWTKMLYSTLEFPVRRTRRTRGVHARRPCRRRRAAGPGRRVRFRQLLHGRRHRRAAGAQSAGDVTYVTPAGNASAWTFMTNELPLVHRALVKAGVADPHAASRHGLRRRRCHHRGRVQRNREAHCLPFAGHGRGSRAAGRACISRSSPRARSSRTQASLRSRASAMHSRRARSCMRSTAAIATRESSMRPRWIHALHSGFSGMSAAKLEPTLPSSWYRSSEVFRIEKERIFCREWMAACREEELPNPGDHLVLDVLGESVLVVRNREGQLRAFYNVCRHRGSRLCRTPAETEALRVALPGGITAARLIVCPYHQWSYDFNGALVAAPHLSAASGFKKQDFHLYPVGVDSLGRIRVLESDPGRGQAARRSSSAASRSGCSAIRWPTCASAPPSATKSRRTGKSFARTTTSATTAAAFIRNCAPWCLRSARRAAAIWIGAAASRIAKAPIRSRTAEPPCGAPSPVSTRTSRCGTRANWSIPIYS